MTAALFPVAMLLLFAVLLLAFCYEPSETDPNAGARPYLSRAHGCQHRPGAAPVSRVCPAGTGSEKISGHACGGPLRVIRPHH